MGILTYASYSTLATISAGGDPMAALNAPPMPAEALEALRAQAQTNLTVGLAGLCFFTGLFGSSYFLLIETALLGVGAWGVGRVAMRLLSGSYFDFFIVLDLLIFAGLYKGLQSVRRKAN